MLVKTGLLFLLLLILQIPVALAHDKSQLTGSWNWDPWILVSLLVLTLTYGKGVLNLKKKRKSVTKEIFYFSLCIIVLIIALISPVDVWSDELQSWHMIQHMLIMMLAAPLFVMAIPLYIYLWSLPLSIRHKIKPIYRWLYGHKTGWYFLWQPVLLWSLFAFTLWIWHLPKFYEAALHIEWLHDIQHISFFITSCLFWRVLLDPIHRFKMGRALGIFYLFATTLHATLLGVFMTLSPKLWYGFYQEKTLSWNMSAIEDQQLAGLIMWMPACSIYVLVTVYIFILWSKEENTLAPLDKIKLPMNP